MAFEFDREKSDDLETIASRLSDAFNWFAMTSSDAASGFPRSKVLEPAHLDIDGTLRDDQCDARVALESVCRQRRALLLSNGKTLNHAPGKVTGRILGHHLRWSFADGAAEAVTRGLFNIEDEPPWDLWIGYVVEDDKDKHEYLVSWIPPSLVAVAGLGLEVDPVQTLFWFDDL